MIKQKKDAFLIVRVSTEKKDALLAEAKDKKVVLSTLVRDILDTHLDGRKETL